MRGSLKERSPGRWQIRLYLGLDERGRPRQSSHSVQGTRKDAEREMRRLLREVDTGRYAPPSRLTVAAYLERWLEDAARPSLSAKTYQQAHGRVHNHIIPALGRILLEQLTPLQLQGFYNQLLTSGRKDGQGGLAPGTVLLHHFTLYSALAQAVQWQLIAYNPATHVRLPRNPRAETAFLDGPGVAAMLTAIEGEDLYIPVLIAVMTGMRRGEVLALRWKDVDLDAGTLSICQALEQTGNGIAFKQPKTGKSRRMIPIAAALADALRMHKAKQSAHRLRIGSLYQNRDLVVAQQDGSPYNPDRVSHNFPALLRRKGLPPLRFHDLRHTHASILMAAGIHPKVVQERLGHSSIGITLDIYSHILPSMQREASEVVSEQVRKAMEG